MKEGLIRLLGGYTEQEYRTIVDKMQLVERPEAETFAVGDRIVFYYWPQTGRFRNSYGGFNYGTIRRIETVNTSTGSHSKYQIDTSKEKRRFAYDFELDVTIISKDIDVLRRKLLHSNSFLPVQNATYGAPNGEDLDQE